MFRLTASAIGQIHEAARQGGAEGLALRLAAQQQADGSIDYHMGFDEGSEDDIVSIAKGCLWLWLRSMSPCSIRRPLISSNWNLGSSTSFSSTLRTADTGLQRATRLPSFRRHIHPRAWK